MVERPRIWGGAGDTGGAMVRFSTETVSEGVVLRAEGEIDLSTAPLLENAIVEAYCVSRRLIVDFSRLEYLDVSGIRVLEQAAVQHRGRFVVVGSRPTIHRLFEILSVTDALPVVPTLEAAREYLRLQ